MVSWPISLVGIGDISNQCFCGEDEGTFLLAETLTTIWLTKFSKRNKDIQFYPIIMNNER